MAAPYYEDEEFGPVGSDETDYWNVVAPPIQPPEQYLAPQQWIAPQRVPIPIPAHMGSGIPSLMTGMIPFSRLATDPQTWANALTYLGSASPELTQQEAENLIEYTPKPGALENISSGVQESVLQGAEAMTSPAMVATLGTGAAIPALGRLLAAGWTAEMLRNAGPAAEALGEAYQSGDQKAIAKATADMAQLGLFAVGGARYAVRGIGPTPGEFLGGRTIQGEGVILPRSMRELELQREQGAEPVATPPPLVERAVERLSTGPVPTDPVERTNFEQELMDVGSAHNRKLGLGGNVRSVSESDSPWVATVDAAGNVVINHSRFAPWLEKLKPSDRVKAVQSVFSEEGIHGVALSESTDATGARVRLIPNSEVEGLWNGLTKAEQALVKESYGKLDPDVTEMSPSAQYGHEYLRRQMQRMLREPIREKAEAKGYQWLKEGAIDMIERVITAARRLVGSKTSKTLDAMLNRMQAHIDAARQARGTEVAPESAPAPETAAAEGPFPTGAEEGEFRPRRPDEHPADYETARREAMDRFGIGEEPIEYQPAREELQNAIGTAERMLKTAQEHNDAPRVKQLQQAIAQNQRALANLPPGTEGPRAMAPREHQNVVTRVREFFGGLPGRIRVAPARFAGREAPVTYTASPDSATALVEYASGRIAAPEVARSMATDVLGDHHRDAAFGRKLGGVLVEDRLRAIRAEFQQAGQTGPADSVTTIIGRPNSPFATEADFRRALNDPDIQAAIARHKQTVQQVARAQHKLAGGEMAGNGLKTDAFVNLQAILSEPAEMFGGGGRGNLQNPLRRPSRFSKKAKGTAEEYELDYRTLAQRMIEGNFEESAKRRMYGQLVRDGLAVINNPGEPAPVFGKQGAVKFTIERKGTPAGGGNVRTFVKNLWVREDIAPEVRQALNVDGKVGEAAILNAANALNAIQLAGPTDAVWHIANMVGSIAGSQGGRNVLIDLARKVPGVNLLDALGRTGASAIRVLRDTPDLQRQIAQLARIGAMRAAEGRGVVPLSEKGALLRLANPANMIHLLDRAGRVVRDDLYQNMVRRGAFDDTPANRRLWVNQMGQYNPRLMSQLQRYFKEWGFSPFVVAGRNFNRMAMRRMILSQGLPAKNAVAAARMKAVDAFGLLATLVVVPSIINYLLNGNPSGRPGTKFGQIDTGKDTKDGKHIIIDPAQWSGVRRGLRITGAQATIEGMRQEKRGAKIGKEAARDIVGGIIHPWTGPAVTGLSVGATGYSPSGYKESENPKDYGANITAMLKQLNPLVGALIEGKEEKRGAVAQLGLSLGGAAGVKAVRPITPLDEMRNLHEKWLAENPDPKVRHDFEASEAATFPLSKYRELDKALQSRDREHIKEAIEEIRPLVNSDKDIVKRMKPFIGEGLKSGTKPLFHESAKLEREFRDSLTPQQQKQYEQAVEDRLARWQLFLDVWNERGDIVEPSVKSKQ